jgi:hypothetical protein
LHSLLESDEGLGSQAAPGSTFFTEERESTGFLKKLLGGCERADELLLEVVVDFECIAASVKQRSCGHRSPDIQVAVDLSCKPVVATVARPESGDFAGLTEGDCTCASSLRETEVSVCGTLAAGATMGECGLE